jgi:hypothetical protein
MKSNWLTALERQYIQTLMTEAIELVNIYRQKGKLKTRFMSGWFLILG